MSNQQRIKVVGVVFIVIIIANMILFALGKISTLYFWFTIIFVAIFAYKVLPWLKSMS